MRQWKTTLLSDYKLDNRSREDVLNQMKELAVSYTPEWLFDTDKPDIGSCIALLFADEMQELIKRYNSIPERHCIELVNMLNISLKQAYPAHSHVLMNIVNNSIPGVKLPKGMKLLADKDDEGGITFETANTVYLANTRLKTIFMTCGLTGNVYPIRGNFKEIAYIDKAELSHRDEAEQETEVYDEAIELTKQVIDFLDDQLKEFLEETEQEEKGFPFRLFDFNRPNYGLHGMLLYHSHLFDVQDNAIVMELKGGEEIIDGIINGDYELKYLGQSGFITITDMVKKSSERIAFCKEQKCCKVKQNGIEYSVLLIEPKDSVMKNIMVSQIGFSSEGKAEPVQNVWDGNCELEPERFNPFGDIMSTYSELYVSHEEYFTKPGSYITLRFHLDFGVKMVSVPRYEEEASLKVIKRKPKKDIYGSPAEVYADEIVLEYFNGTGWKRIVTTAPINQLFQNARPGKCEISFECPADWKSVEEGSSDSHWLRMRLLRADNCYYQPAIHNYPILSDLTVEYSYEHHFDTPQKLYCFQGSRKRDMTNGLAENPQIPVFLRNPYNSTSLYLGFDKRMEDGPVSLMIDIDEVEGFSGRNIKYYYSTREGFARLKLIDNTEGLAHVGTIVFIPPTDMAKLSIEGEEAYWIRITDEKQEIEHKVNKSPLIKSIRMNAVEVNNIDTLDEQDYYIDMFGPNMTFLLNADNILDVDVWVNEVESFTENEMRGMLIEQPACTRAEYNLKGGIEEFYIKWEEVDNFDSSNPGDRHYVIDRMNHTIAFGDGVHVRIPKNTKSIAFKVIVRRCEGKIANVAAGSIRTSMSNLMFVSDIYNPKQAYGGMDMETMDEALRRGMTLLGSKNRLISVLDYEKEVLNFSNCINQVKVVVDKQKDGSRIPGAISIVILMDDFKDGGQSFLKMRSRLKNHLLTKCELSVNDKYLDVVQPLYVKVSVQLWVRLIETDDSFDIQQHLIQVLEHYLDPIENQFWEIGRMVSAKQIGMKLNIEKGSALIERTMISAMYEDENGQHEADIDSLAGNPYVLVMSGEHKVHFI